MKQVVSPYSNAGNTSSASRGASLVWRVQLRSRLRHGTERAVELATGFVVVMALMMLTSVAAFAQKTVAGKVQNDATKKPLPGVTVKVKGTLKGSVTNKDGAFTIAMPAGSNVLTFESIGMKRQEVTVGDASEISVSMKEDVMLLEEVVVTAVGQSAQKKTFGYALQEVKGQEITQAREASVAGALAGKVAGVQVIQGTGAAGGSVFVQVRGASSFQGSNQPLFVVDGVPIDNSQQNTGGLLGSVAYSNRAADISPEDIESISVLKGPAATALYGILANSGAIIITTKRAKEGGNSFNITFNSSIGFDQVNKLPALQNTFAQGLNGQLGSPEAAAALRVRAWGPRVSDLRLVNDPNWLWDRNGRLVTSSDPAFASGAPARTYDPYVFFQTGVRFENSLQMSGSNTNGAYTLAVNNFIQTGIVPNNRWERTNIRLHGAYKFTEALRADASVTYIRSGGNRIEQGSNTSGVMLGLTRTPPTFDLTNGVSNPAQNPAAYRLPDGRPRSYRGLNAVSATLFTSGFDNPYWTVNENPLRDVVDRIIASGKVTYNITDWMSAEYRVGADISEDRRKQRFAIGSASFPQGRVTEDQYYTQIIDQNVVVSLRSDDNLFGVTGLKMRGFAGYNLYLNRFQNNTTFGDQLSIDGFFNLSNAAQFTPAEFQSTVNREAVYAEWSTEFNDMLFVNVRGRTETSTTLPAANNRYNSFAADFGFIFTKLFGLDEESALSFGKIRGSYALTGKDATAFATQTLWVQTGPNTNASDGWTNGIQFPFNGNTGFTQSNILGNNVLRPESAVTLEGGLELKFFANRLGLDVTYYNETRADLLIQAPLARATGFASINRNAGRMRNEGIEVTLNATPIEIRESNFRWDINANFSHNRNTVLELAPGVPTFGLVGFAGINVRAVQNEQFGTIFGGRWLRNEAGQRVIDDNPASPNYGFPIVAATEGKLGVVVPDWIAGIRNTFTYEGLSLSVLFDIRQGGDMWNGTMGALDNYGMTQRSATQRQVQNFAFQGVGFSTTSRTQVDGRVTGGQAASIPIDITARPTAWQAWYLGNGGGFGAQGEDFVEKTSWVRLREATLSYTLPSTIFEGSIVRGLNVFVTGRNLWLSTAYTGIDPETNLAGANNGQGLEYYNMPSTRSYNVGVSVRF
jgi:TonB-linked SusC/RagA family outer membrane protein